MERASRRVSCLLPAPASEKWIKPTSGWHPATPAPRTPFDYPDVPPPSQHLSTQDLASGIELVFHSDHARRTRYFQRFKVYTRLVPRIGRARPLARRGWTATVIGLSLIAAMSQGTSVARAGAGDVISQPFADDSMTRQSAVADDSMTRQSAAALYQADAVPPFEPPVSVPVLSVESYAQPSAPASAPRTASHHHRTRHHDLARAERAPEPARPPAPHRSKNIVVRIFHLVEPLDERPFLGAGSLCSQRQASRRGSGELTF